jgi:LacI family transcriptional regulator
MKPLTTVDMNLKRLGHDAGLKLMQLIAGEALRGIHRTPCSLIVRDSCGGQALRRAG